VKFIFRKIEISSVAFAGAAGGVLFFFFHFLVLKPNRLVNGVPLFAWQVLSVPQSFFLPCLWCIALLLSLSGNDRTIAAARGILGNIAIVGVFLLVSTGAGRLLGGTHSFARISPGIGAWLMVFAAYVLIRSSLESDITQISRFVISFSGLTALAVLLLSGVFDPLSIMKEYQVRKERFFSELLNHFVLSGSSVITAAAVGIPLGIMAFRRKFLEKPVFAVVNTLQTIPSLALFGILMAPLSFLTQKFVFLQQLGVKGIGWTPAFIALTLYALLPIVRNTYTSLKIIDPAVVEAGKGMGMSKIQRMLQIEIPLALPVVLSGIRTALVQGIGNTTVAALIGAGGCGVFVLQGIGQAAPDLILLGVLPVVGMAVTIDKTMHGIIRIVTLQRSRAEKH
jgi:osmoprotectant transport system permease protein